MCVLCVCVCVLCVCVCVCVCCVQCLCVLCVCAVCVCVLCAVLVCAVCVGSFLHMVWLRHTVTFTWVINNTPPSVVHTLKGEGHIERGANGLQLLHDDVTCGALL